jgi:hypothetical protein
MTAAPNVKVQSRLGQSGPQTGAQLFNKINCNLVLFGQDLADAPLPVPQFPDLAPKGLVITNTAGVIALKLTCPTDPGTNTIVRASASASQGREVCCDYRILGMCPAPVEEAADINQRTAAAARPRQ